MPADLVIINGKLITVNRDFAIMQAVAVKDAKIVAAGTNSAQGLVQKVVPLYSKDQKREAILSAMKQLNANGITSYTKGALGPGGDAFTGGGMGAECIDIYKELCEEGDRNHRFARENRRANAR
jgi:predicted amidohydrolase YtcJ